MTRTARTPAESSAARDRTHGERTDAEPIQASPEAKALLARAVEEAARLLDADGAMVYLVDAETKRLVFGVDAGIRNREAQQLIRGLSLPVGVGLFGHAVASGEVIVSGDYRRDRRFTHSPTADRIVAIANMRSMAAAPLSAGGEVLGALGAYSSRIDDFDEAEIALLRALADHAATAIANARLVERLSSSEARFRHLVTSSPDLVWETDANGRFTFFSPRLAELTGWDPEELVGESWPAIVAPDSMEQAQATWEQLRADPAAVRKIRFLLRPRQGEPIPAEVYAIGSERDGTFTGAHGSVRDLTESEQLMARLRDQAAELERRVEAQRTLAEMAAQLTSLRDPSAALVQTLQASVRLLGGHGGQIGMVVNEDGVLRWGDGHSLARGQLTPFTKDDHTLVDDGVSGRAVRESRASWTDDYLADASFPHDDNSDRVARRLGIRAVIAAPLVGEEGPIGAIGVYSEEPGVFNADAGELLRLLADQATIVLTNARLYTELEHRVEAQRSLGEIATRITAIRDPGDVLQRTLDEAVRLLDADGGRIELVSEDGGLHWALGHSAIDLPIERDEHPRPEGMGGAEEGVSGRAVAERRVIRTGDYLADEGFEHAGASDRYIRQHGIRSVISAPLIGEDGAIGSLTVHAQAREAFDAADEELLEVLASQAAIAVTNARLYEQLGEESAALARQTDSQQRLLQINERLLSTLELSSVLELIADGLKSVVWYDYLGVYRVEMEEGLLRPVLARDRNAEAVLGFPIPRGQGVTWWSVEHREPVLLNDALSDPRVIRIPGTPDEPEAIIIVPLLSGEDVIGAMNIARRGGAEVAFTDADFEIVQLFAGQAAIAITNARLYERLQARAEAQRSLSEIAAQIAALHEPSTVIQRAVVDAARLLGAERAQINMAVGDGAHLDRPIAAAPIPPAPDDVMVPIGSGIAGMAAVEKRVRWTGDYLGDEDFPHDAGDTRIQAQGIHSMMSAPLIGSDRLLGTITVQSKTRNAFGPDDAELLKLLADQAAIALTNAALYAEVEESERRYRHLVDNSPDIVWSVDADGRFTFFSDSLEARTGWKPEQLLGERFTVLTGATTRDEAVETWRLLRNEPNREQRVRLDLPLPDGRIAKTEVAMTGTVVDGRFAGAHGAVRDISERERLEGDLRSQAAELAASQERAHLARELHDSVTQALFSMGLTLRTLELLLGTDTDAARTKLVELRELQKDALAEMRTLIFELRPSSLESDGLVQALRTHATAVQRRTGLIIVVDAEPIDRLPLLVEEALYRIGQEALHNVVKHANAANATIRIAHDGEQLRLAVTDDGVGFDPAAVPRGHLGLIGMRQRIELVGGELRVESRAGRGTTIEASVPAAAASAE